MSDPLPRTDRAWKDAESLIERVEGAARRSDSAASFFDDLTSGLRLTAAASAVVIAVFEKDQRSVLSRNGVSIRDEANVKILELESQEIGARRAGVRRAGVQQTKVMAESHPLERDGNEEGRDFAAHSHWDDGDSRAARLTVLQRFQPDRSLQIDLWFDEPVEFALRKPLSELAEVILELAVPVMLRGALSDLRRRIDHQSDRDALIQQFNEGIGVTDSLTSIASAVASSTSIERVSLLQFRSSWFRLVTTSTQNRIDRRAQQVRLLERLVSIAFDQADPFLFTIGQPTDLNTEVATALEAYCHQSGSREIYMRTVRDAQDNAPVAAYVMERFQAPSDAQEGIPHELEPIRLPMENAIRNAVRRDDAGWGFLVSRIFSPTVRRRLQIGTIILAIALLAGAMIPVELKVPVEGRVVPTKRSRLFASDAGIVADIPVRNGQTVQQGDPLVILRSPELELQLRSLEGTLATAQTRLASLTAMRSRGTNPSSRQRESNVAAEEQVLRTEIKGLSAQLQLVHEQQTSLTVLSPIDGIVDRWDLQQSLNTRPVTHGQHLLDVISAADGWTVELELPEKNINYLLDQQQTRPATCTFRLRSNPTENYQGAVQQIADVAHLDPLGRSMVTVTVPLNPRTQADFRVGATVIAQVHCGKRSLGFVCLRSLIQWYRSSRWF